MNLHNDGQPFLTRPEPAARVYRHQDIELLRTVNVATLRVLLAILDEKTYPDEEEEPC